MNTETMPTNPASPANGDAQPTNVERTEQSLHQTPAPAPAPGVLLGGPGFDWRKWSEDLENKRRNRRWWGPWRFYPRNLTLCYMENRKYCLYEIDLERMDTSAKMLDWIFQVRGKTWCSTEDAGYLLEALDDIFDPQACVCGYGRAKTIDPAKVVRERMDCERVRFRAEELT